MGLFSSKKKQQQKQFSPPLPEFPDFNNSQDSELPEFPDISEDDGLHYEPTIADIKREVTKDEDDYELPLRQGSITGKTRSRMGMELPETEEPKRRTPDKPIFVKIDKYKEVLHNLDMLKVKINDAEEMLKGLEDVRTQEEEKLTQWKKDLQAIKEKLLSIDEELFEV